MPDGATPPPPPSLEPPPAPPIATYFTDAAPQVLSSFPAYVVDDEIPRTKTPEPIKVKRVKKGASSAKSRRVVAE
jgi:AP-3 complex subunit delta